MNWPTCPTCGQPTPKAEVCVCGHLKSQHRTDLKTARCGAGCGVPGLACDCPEYRPAREETGATPATEGPEAHSDALGVVRDKGGARGGSGGSGANSEARG